jgi:2-polyprenyl-3-methyl-5-hydroxy-6-metoxy-1,4-benzoquinol methylase
LDPATVESLDKYNFSSYSGFNAQLIRWRYEMLAQHFHGRSCLELGSSDGQGTEFLLKHFAAVTAVDGSSKAIRSLRSRYSGHPGLTAVESLFEELALSERFDTVVAGHILEHVDNPSAVLRVARDHLAPDGVLIADVPNGRSIHRQLGVKLGMLEQVTDLNDADRSIGHQRVYTLATLQSDVEGAGLVVTDTGGVFLKVLSNAQIEDLFSPELQRGFLELGSDLPELAAEIYVVARRP